MTSSDEYRERLLPRWWAWLLAYSFVAMVAIAYGAALGATHRLAGRRPAASYWHGPPARHGAHDRRRRRRTRGRRRHPAAHEHRTVEAVTGARIAELRGPGSDARIFVSLRPWSSADGVLVRLDDPEDPHPAWLFSSRHPARVVEALAATMGR